MGKRILWAVFALLFLAGVSPAGPAQAHGDPPDAASSGKHHEEGAAKDPPDPLKYGPVKLGLDSLVRPEAATNFSLGSFSFTPGNDEGRILLRIRPSVTVSPSENFSARVEGQWYAFYDDKDFSIFSLYQGYVEGVLPGVKGISLKAGRQEFIYGSTFLLGADTFYDGLTFDAAKVSLKPAEKFSLDLFGGQYVKKWAGD
ncbi:MAG: outer membrane channel, partial [Deltaproteobacteria bacterium]|nr:outer membrane channel [Deltaproteobacteria bacterium]